MPKIESILAIDVGQDSLKFAEFSYPPNSKAILEKFAFAEYGGDLKDEKLWDSLASVFKKTMEENEFKAKKVYLSISGAFIKFVKLPPVGEDENKVKQIVEMEAKQNIPFAMDEVVWDYQLIKSNEADSEIEVVFVVEKNEDIKPLIKIIEDNGLAVGLIDVSPTSCFNAARVNGVGETDCEMILNIGSRFSSLVFIDNGRFFYRPIPIAGNSITQQISKEFGIPFADAEEMKRRHGFVALGGAYEEPDSEVAATVSKIVRNVMTRLHGEINRSINLYRSQQKGRKPAKLYLSGGSSVMAFTPRFFSEKLRIPVEYFNAFQAIALSPDINKEGLAEVAHMFSEVIGLSQRCGAVCPVEISLLPDSLRKMHELKQKIPYFFGSVISVILCLGITFWAFYSQDEISAKRIKMAKNIVTRTSVIQNEVNGVQRELENVKNEYSAAQKILSERVDWIELINELQNVMPDKVWLISVKATSSSSNAQTNASAQAAPGAAPLFPMFGPAQNRNAKAGNQQAQASAASINYLLVEGHSLILKSGSLEEQFKENIKTSPLFTNNVEEIPTLAFEPSKGNVNITTFKLEIKLRKPIRK